MKIVAAGVGLALALAGGLGARVAPLVVVEARGSHGLQIDAPRVVDRVEGSGAAIEAFRFGVAEAPAEAGPALASVRIESAGSLVGSFSAAIPQLRRGAMIEIPADAAIPADLEGRLTARLLINDQDGESLFEGRYTLGYPRYETSGPPRRVIAGAPVRDDFESQVIDEERWRIWRSDPSRLQIEQKEGRLWIRIRGDADYNGLVSRLDIPGRDVVGVCRMGIESAPRALHAGILHLCGSGLWSPDHWFEIRLRDHEGKFAAAVADAAVPPRFRGGYRGPYELPNPAGEGYVVKVVCEGATNLCTGFAQVHGEWWQIGDPVEVPARRSRLEIKTAGSDEKGDGSSIWFDDCRLYQRPETHYVSVVLVRPSGGGPGARGGGADAVAGAGEGKDCFDARNGMVPACDFTVELYASDGKTLVDRTTTGTAFGYAMLKLDKAPWDLYPAAAVVRVKLNGLQVGPDHRIEQRGVEGLYPDDVYTIEVE
ncbi:MAG TPA: hypothetical protein VGK94_15300 [Candidatus Polarisedimenticolia bacterium]|jgi:hypothetical protein